MRPGTLTAEDKHGLIPRSALLSRGVREGTLSGWVRRGALVEVLPAVYRLPSTRLDWLGMCHAVAMWGGDACAFSHYTAAALHGLEMFIQEAPIHVSFPTSRKPPPHAEFELRVHRARGVGQEVTYAQGLRVTNMDRTLFDLAETMSEMGLECVLAAALRRGLVKPERLRKLRASAQGRKGGAKYANAIDVRDKTLVRTDSVLEDQFVRAFAEQGLELMPLARCWVAKWDMRYRADFAFPEYKLAIEIDSWEHHAGRDEWAADVMKNNHVVSWGWSVLRFTREALDDPRHTAQLIREALVERGW